MSLRPYQVRAIESVRQVISQRPVLVAPTGSGKTTIAAAIAELAIAKGKRVLFVAHRKEIIDQAFERLPTPGVIMAGRREDRSRLVQVASIQTLARRKLPEAELTIIDECHHAVGRSYARLFEHSRWVLGLTATPFRLDGRGLGERFGAIIIAATPRELMDDGYLMEPRVFVGQVNPDLRGVRTRAGDYEQGALGLAMSAASVLGDIVGSWERIAAGRRTILFAASVAHSKLLVEMHGARARHLDGETPKEEREEVLAALKAHEIDIVSNYGILGEGVDIPEVDVVQIARPTKSHALYLQMVGRALRPSNGKSAPIVLDHGGCTDRFGLCDAPIEYTLDGIQPKEDRPTLRTCRRCFAIYLASLRKCPECAEVPEIVPRPPPKAVEAEMVEISKTAAASRKLAQEKLEYDLLCSTAYFKGYKVGWARHRFHARFGRWPSFYHIERKYGYGRASAESSA